MKVIYDNVKYESDKQKVKKTHKIPKKIIDIGAGLLFGCIVLLFAFAISLTFIDISFEQIRIYLFCVIGIALVILTLMSILSMVIAPVPANSVYGELLENKCRAFEYRVMGEGKNQYLRITYETPKGKIKTTQIPIEEKGFYYDISEDVFDLTKAKDNYLHWYRPVTREIEMLKKEAERHELPEHLKKPNEE